MSNTAQLKKEYAERIAPALMKQFNYSSSMQIPVLKKIVINQGLGMATADKKIMDNASAQGAELLITACPLCSYNLLHNTDGRLPVVYFTELLAEALGCGEEDA